jgi:peptide/nickel transport system permease protein
VVPITLVTGTTLVGGLVLTEGALSFLGVGIPPPSPSWGGMLAQGRVIMLEHPLVILWPGIFLAVFVFGWNMLGDGLRDALDPRLRKGA